MFAFKWECMPCCDWMAVCLVCLVYEWVCVFQSHPPNFSPQPNHHNSNWSPLIQSGLQTPKIWAPIPKLSIARYTLCLCHWPLFLIFPSEIWTLICLPVLSRQPIIYIQWFSGQTDTHNENVRWRYQRHQWGWVCNWYLLPRSRLWVTVSKPWVKIGKPI